MIVTLGALAAFVLGHSPKSLGQEPDGEPSSRMIARMQSSTKLDSPLAQRSLSRDRAFLTLCGGMTLALFAQTGLVAHRLGTCARARHSRRRFSRALSAIVEEVAQVYEGKLKAVRLDVEQSSQTTVRYGIHGIPALPFFKDGEVVDQMATYVP
jgi:thiol-disulfide isomerase/thioredoxin